MQQGGDFSTYYHQPPLHHQYPNPNPNELIPNPLPPTYASAPPFSNYPSSDYSPFYNSYSPHPQNPNPIPPTPPSYTQNPSPYQSFNPSPFPFFPSAASDPQTTQYPPPPPPSSTTIQQPPPSPYYPYDSHSSSLNPNPNANPNPSPNPSFSAHYSSPSYPHLGASSGPIYENPYENSLKFDHGGAYLDQKSSHHGGQSLYGQSISKFEQNLYDKKQESGVRLYDRIEEGAYAYDGGKVEPYGARGTGGGSAKSSSSMAFDDYGRSTSFSSGKAQVGSSKIVRAVPKVETDQDAKSGVQKFRVKLLPEGLAQSTMDVLCQVGLDGIRMLDPNTNRTLRIYPLETVTRWEVTESSIYTFWAKSSVDIEPRRIRLQSSSYTTNTILDTVTAATVQLKEMGGRDSFGSSKVSADAGKLSELSTEKKKGLGNWMNLMKPGNEEKDHWVPDEAVTKCTACGTDFGAFNRKHHCRNCGDIFCDKCTAGRIALTADEQAQPVRVCDRCLAEVSQRLSNAKEAPNKSAVQQSHVDLARKLQEEMDKKRKSVSVSKSSDGSGRRMREVACPTCTVHLQVQVPSSGSETIECGVCQHPFLVSAH
ncbi:RING/FYVE/PHD zinc finger superfamily protein [Tasmannia lanceolata]|uniref:RING/FYVE/PHD zinc finger superfamily protein n=1 Tax=Tasmannia lanceolata TaxID=3420 RepID=UPI0040643FAB